MSVVTVSGYPGSGTSTVARLLSGRTGLPVVNAGDVFRGLAQERGQDIAAFAEHVRRHPEVDREIDERQVDVARRGEVILEGRLAGFMTHRAGVPALRVWLACDLDERVRRVAGREALPEDEARRGVLERQRAERERYLAFYGFDLDDLSLYDLVLDSGALRPAPLAEAVLAAMEDRP